MKKTAPVALASAGAILLGLLTPTAAIAVTSMSGYIECNPTRSVTVKSTTTGGTISHATLHITSTRSYPFYGAGNHSHKFAIPGTKWEVRSDGKVTKASASCS